ncbi:lecithin retinol acyltransferase family protein, partial [Massilistercora timonensis]
EDRYHLLFNNCEHFAIWSKTNISESYQVKNKMKYLSVFLRMPVWHYV